MHLLFPGNGAVMVFFVLSGYVLWGSFARKQSTVADAPDYLVARAVPPAAARDRHDAAVLAGHLPDAGRTHRQHGPALDQHEQGAVVAAGRDDRQPGDLHRVAFVPQRSAQALHRAVRRRGRGAVLPRQSIRGLSAGVSPRRADPPCPGADLAKPRAADRGARGAAAAEHRLFISRHNEAARNPRRGRDRRLRRRAAPADARNRAGPVPRRGQLPVLCDPPARHDRLHSISSGRCRG